MKSNFQFEKRGHVYQPDGHQTWAFSHAYVPTPVMLEDRLRVYAAFRDNDGIGRVGYVDVAPEQPTLPLAISSHPVLDIGKGFDVHGVTPSCVMVHEGETRLYYFGWQRGGDVRYRLFSGVAMARGDSFERWSDTPILGPSTEGRYLRSAPFVMHYEGAFHMWYVSGSHWIEVGGATVPTYGIYHQASENGLDWAARGTPVITPTNNNEYGFGRPWVQQTAHGLRLWYSVRTRDKGYRLGFAQQNTQGSWQRCEDLPGMDVTPGAWDSKMMCFPAVIHTRAGTLLFYNGNGFGATGFGVAELRGKDAR